MPSSKKQRHCGSRRCIGNVVVNDVSPGFVEDLPQHGGLDEDRRPHVESEALLGAQLRGLTAKPFGFFSNTCDLMSSRCERTCCRKPGESTSN